MESENFIKTETKEVSVEFAWYLIIFLLEEKGINIL